ncbi:MAG: MFS transporter, partial [Gemmataceae bacterium]|nr:MFS transporter [Gemmataceae bacterium]
MHGSTPVAGRQWISRTVLAIVLATFFSDVSHEMCTAVLPLYVAVLGLGPAALGLIEGVADFLVSISKLAGGYVGHHLRGKRPWASLGYLVTTLATWGLAFAGGVAALLTLRGAAWIGRGFRAPLRDYLLADAVKPTHYGRAYGLERAGDMLGAVVGPLLAVCLVWLGLPFRSIILWTIVPGLLAAGAFFFFTQERRATAAPGTERWGGG